MPGAERLRDSAVLMDLVKKQQQADKLHAAICATPAVAFEPNGGCGEAVMQDLWCMLCCCFMQELWL
jgi:putative intracellular protease/amidase